MPDTSVAVPPRHEDLMRMRQLLSQAEAKLRHSQRRCGTHAQENEPPLPLHALPRSPQPQSVPAYNPPAEPGTSTQMRQLEEGGRLFYALGSAERLITERNLSTSTTHFPDQYLRCDVQSVCMLPPSLPTLATRSRIDCLLTPRSLGTQLADAARAELLQEISRFEAIPHDTTVRLADAVPRCVRSTQKPLGHPIAAVARWKTRRVALQAMSHSVGGTCRSVQIGSIRERFDSLLLRVQEDCLATARRVR
jgi:hypothetical protein